MPRSCYVDGYGGRRTDHQEVRSWIDLVSRQQDAPGQRYETSAPAELVDLERGGVGDAHALAVLAEHAVEELGRVEVLPAEAVDVGLVRTQGVDAGLEGLGDVDAVLALG